MTPMSAWARAERRLDPESDRLVPVGENDEAATNSPSDVFHVTWPWVRTRALIGAEAPSEAPHQSSVPREIVSTPL